MKIFWPYLLFLLLSSGSCKGIREELLPSFTVKIPSINISIPVLPFVQDKEVPVGALKVHINMDSAVRANTAGAFGATSVSSVKVKNIIFDVENADLKNNLSNFETGRLRIYSDNDTSKVDIAIIQFPKFFSQSITVNPEYRPDISKYLRGGELYYNIYWKNRRVTNKKLKLKILVSLLVQ